MAYRIDPRGKITPVRLNPASRYSSFKHPDFLGYLLKINRYEVRIIKFTDGTRMVVRSDSFMKNTKELYNKAASRLLHERSNQKSAIVRGPVIIVEIKDWET